MSIETVLLRRREARSVVSAVSAPVSAESHEIQFENQCSIRGFRGFHGNGMAAHGNGPSDTCETNEFQGYTSQIPRGPPDQAPGEDIESLAAVIAAEFGITSAMVLDLLDDEDREAIITGVDPCRVDAWRCAAQSLLGRRSESDASPQSHVVEQLLRRCNQCSFAVPVESAPGLVDCSAQMRAPGACGPYRWWATDAHTCAAFVGHLE